MSGITTSTIAGYGVVIGVAATIYYISNRNHKGRRPAASKFASKVTDLKEEIKGEKPKKGKKTAVQSEGDSDTKKQKKKTVNNNTKQQATQAVPEPATPAPVSEKKERDEEVDNREFARQMSKAKTGAIAAPQSKGDARQKSVKQKKAQEKLAVETSSDNFTAPSSANGGDADDDRSSLNSPDLSATSIESPVAHGISDMLEKPASGPSILNITAPTNNMPHKKAKKTPVETPTESKKQRQNRQKAEARKMEREQDEAARLKLLEQQRRTARTAEGRAAKDGSAFMASKAPTSSWSSPPSINKPATDSSNKIELLDTVEKPAAPSSTAKPEPVYSESQEAGSKWGDLPSEEEQIRIFTEDENWKTVKTKEEKLRERKAAKAANSSIKEGNSSDEQNDYGVPPLRAPAPPGQKYRAILTHVDENNQVVEREVELADSEWVVS